MSYHGDLPIYIIDSFSSVPFGGNPAAVCLDPTSEGLESSVAQKIAAEMNLSETAFVRKLRSQDRFDNGDRFGLRWFTPTMEINLCGHATLASAAVLFYCVGNQSTNVEFETRSGTLTARKTDNGITLDFPLDNPIPLQNKDEFKDVLEVLASVFPIQEVLFGPHNRFLLVRIKDSFGRKAFEDLSVPFARLRSAYKGSSMLALSVTMKGCLDNGCVDNKGEGYDFVSRFFGPWVGIDEDPVTGAAHTVLSAYWSKQLGKSKLYARQLSERGGDLRLLVREEDGRVDISGPATVVLKGQITI